MRTRQRIRAALAVGLVATGLLTGPVASATPGWTGTWAASMMRPSPGFAPNWSEEGFDNHTVRQVVRVSAGGALARIRLSNAFGTRPLTVTGATVARSAGGAAVRPGSLWHLTFRGSRSATVRPGDELASDPAPLRVAPLDTLTVTLYLAKPTGPATQHLMAGATTYRAAGDHRADVGAGAFTETTGTWYYLAGVDVLGPVLGAAPRRDVVATFGDSITDGAASTVDANNRYPDELAELLAGRRGVLNAGIGGNRVLSDAPCLGDRATARFARDVLDEPRVGTVVVLEGINDIGASVIEPNPCLGDAPEVTAADLIAGHRDLIRQARARGLTVIGATILPFKAADYYYTEAGEAVRDEVNEWMRSSGEYDAVADFDRILAAPGDPDLLDPAYDSGDGLHPNDDGYHAMAVAVADVLE